MRPVAVVVSLAGRQDPAKVGQVPDKRPAGKLTAASADSPLHDRVHAGIRTPLRTIRRPAAVNTVSKPSPKMASRSCSTNLTVALA
jgi:hypothetical protein